MTLYIVKRIGTMYADKMPPDRHLLAIKLPKGRQRPDPAFQVEGVPNMQSGRDYGWDKGGFQIIEQIP